MSGGQVGPLVAMRWRMVRSRRTRAVLLGVDAIVLCLAALVVGRAPGLPDTYREAVAIALSTAYLSFLVISVAAPLVAGGGAELFPPDQLTAFPITAATTYRSTLLLLPLNLAWTVNAVSLVALTSYALGPDPWGPGRLLPLVTSLTWILTVSVVGHTLGWWLVGVRSNRRGRRVSNVVLAGAGLAVLVVAVVDRLPELVDASPTRSYVFAALLANRGYPSRWMWLTPGLVLLAAATLLLGRHVCAWALRRPDDSAVRLDSARHRRREQRGSVLGELLAVDHASVWRSAPLRRGLAVLALLPATFSLGAALDWASLTLLPGLVAAGAGLLFGVNAFCLDASGRLWLSSTPHPPRLALLSKAIVLAEVCLIPQLVTIVAGAIRAPGEPSATEALALLVSPLAGTALVVATCLRLSVTRPHRADLRGPRDTPAPPGAMTAYSARLSLMMTAVGISFSSVARLHQLRLPLLLGLVLVLLSARSLLATRRRWDDAMIRARVSAVVAAG